MRTPTRHRGRPRPFVAPVAGGILALALAACSGAVAAPSVPAAPNASGSPSASPAASLDPRDAMLDYAKCMRGQGVDFPDPQNQADGSQLINIDTGAPGFEAANEACKSKLPPIGVAMDPAANQQFQDQMLKFAKCMRDHGVDFPDPKFDSAGGAGAVAVNGNLDPNAPAFQAAQKACGSNLPGGVTTVTSGGAPVTAP